MRKGNLGNVVMLSNLIIENYVKEGDVALDCTVGNGHDTRLLAEHVGEKGKVYGFDIQDQAIENTKELLSKSNLENRVLLYKESHEDIDRYVDELLNIVIYNLGYLPGSDKSVITRAKSTVKSIKKSLNLLDTNGILLIASYIGHLGGIEENNEVENLLAGLNQKKFNVIKNEFINQKNNPPILYVVEKIK